jgi:ABC-2 type transport system permease protein
MSQTAQPAAVAPAAARQRPSALALFVHALRYQNKVFLRNPFSAFFSLAFPTMFLLLFGTLLGGEPIDELPGVRVSQFLTPSIVVFAVVSTAFINLSTVVAISRDEGILKRIRGTPVPPAVYLGARIGSAVWFSLIAALLQVLAGVLLFGVRIVWALVPAALLTLLLGIACFCSLGMALAAVIPNGEAAPAVANFTAMPILFVSGVFFPLDNAPSWIQWIGLVFPVKHFNDALQDDFNPFLDGSGFFWDHLGVMALWLAAGVFVAVRYFRWEPRGAIRPRR